MPDDIEKSEEKKLLNILKTNSSYLRMPALKKLIKIYKKKPEDMFIYSFFENHNYADQENTNFVLECLFEFFDQISYQSRVEKIYNNEKIMKRFMLLVKSTYAQTITLVILAQIFHGRQCKTQWVENIVEVFCTTKRKIIEGLAGRVIIMVAKSKYPFSYDMICVIKRKIDRFMCNCSTVCGTECTLAEISRVLCASKDATVDEYVTVLSNGDICTLFTLIHHEFLQKHCKEIESKIDLFTGAYYKLLQSHKINSAAVMEHMLFLIEVSELFARKLAEGPVLDLLYRIVDTDDTELSYLATKIIAKIL